MLTGGCLCGKVRYEIDGEPGPLYNCHCPDCRRSNGSSFATNLSVEVPAFRITQGSDALAAYESSAGKLRRFCQTCGSPIYNEMLGGDALTVRAGTLDGDPGARPASHVFAASKAPWFEIRDDLLRPDFGKDFPALAILRATGAEDLDFVLALEQHPDNTAFIGSWTREQHAAAIADPEREHWIIEREAGDGPLGYLIAFDLRAHGEGVYVKRIVVQPKGDGLGREALARFGAHAFHVLAAEFLWLSVFRENELAQHAYAAAGFSEWRTDSARAETLRALVGNRPSNDRMLMRWER